VSNIYIIFLYIYIYIYTYIGLTLSLYFGICPYPRPQFCEVEPYIYFRTFKGEKRRADSS
jgi:hypothetical protein